jgi:hypothetical protein
LTIVITVNIEAFTEFAAIFNRSAFKQLTMVFAYGISNLAIIKGPSSNNTIVKVRLNQAGTG